MTSAGAYTAPALAGTYHVIATSAADTTVSGTSTITVTAPPPPPAAIAVSITPSTAAVTTGGTAAFTATVANTSNQSVTWSIQEGAAGGTIAGGGVYTAPAAAGTYHVLATSVADTTASAAATVTVTAPPISVAINPVSATVTASGRVTFSATVSNSSNQGVTWSVREGASGGSVTSAGLYTAPSTAGTYHVVATSQADTTKTSTAAVTVSAPPPVSVAVSPTTASVGAGATVAFTATVSNSSNQGVTWSVREGASGGAVTSAGVYTAPSAAGTYHVVATSQADATKSATATVTVTGGGGSGLYALPADRTTTWKPGVTYNGGIPANRTQCGSTFTPSSGQAAIQNALDTCPDNTYVLLGPGTYTLNPGLTITRSNITLRGSGAGSTILQTQSGVAGNPVQVGQWDGAPSGWMDWRPLTSDAVKDAYSVTVSSATGLQVGEIVHVDEQYDSSLAYYNRKAPAGDCSTLQELDYLGWGECRCARSDCVPRGCTATTNVTTAQNQSRPVGQAMEIASISGNTVTFTSPFHWTFRTNHAARLARLGNGTNLQPAVKYVGVERLTAQHGFGGDGWGNIYFSGTAYCWAKNVESASQVAGGSIVIAGGFRNEIRDSYLHSAQDPNPGGAGYGFEVETYASDNLLENNIAWSFNKVIAMRSSGGGNVIGYNYFEDGYGQGYPTIVEVGINGSHMIGSHMELFEGNQGFNFDSDSYWGTQFDIVAFRNHLTTLRRNLPGNLASLIDESNRRAVGLTSYQRNYSFVGNVLGYPNGYLQNPAIGDPYPSTFSPQPAASAWQYEWVGPWDNAYLWQIGYDGSGYNCTNGWGKTPDATAVTTTLRDGNFDYLTHQVHWHGVGGTGVGQTTPPAASTLPNSLYLTGKPSFFGSNPWPWVDGSNAANPIPGTLPARTRFDAGTPNLVP